MNDRYKDLTVKLSDILREQTLDFIFNVLQNSKEEDTSHLINLVVSAHISSLANCMIFLSEDNEKMDKVVKTFIASLIHHVSKSNPIETVEMIN